MEGFVCFKYKQLSFLLLYCFKAFIIKLNLTTIDNFTQLTIVHATFWIFISFLTKKLSVRHSHDKTLYHSNLAGLNVSVV